MDISNEIRFHLRNEQRTPYAIAKDAGLDPAFLRRFMKGKQHLGAESISRVCDVLGLKLIRTAQRISER